MNDNDQRDIVDLLAEISVFEPGGPPAPCLFNTVNSWSCVLAQIAARAKTEIVALRTLHMLSPGPAKTSDRHIQPGDTVIAKIGGPIMLVEKIRQTGSPEAWLVNTVWFDRLNRIVCHTFDEAALRLWHPPQEIPPTQPQPQMPKTAAFPNTEEMYHLSIAAQACEIIGWESTAKAMRALRHRALEESSPAPADAPSLPIVDQAVMDREPAEMTPYGAKPDGGLHGFQPTGPEYQKARSSLLSSFYGDPHP